MRVNQLFNKQFLYPNDGILWSNIKSILPHEYNQNIINKLNHIFEYEDVLNVDSIDFNDNSNFKFESLI